MKVIFAAALQGTKKRNAGVLAGAAFAMMLTSSAAFAQCSPTAQTGGAVINNIGSLAIPTSATSASLSAAIGNVNTAFLTQQGSAFVSAPANPTPEQPGGGVWARAVGGQVNISSTSSSTGVSTQPGPGVINTAVTNCANSQRENFAGVQVGADIAKLNWNSWNIHLGTTAGYLGAKTSDNAGFRNSFDIPFFGTYLVATKGRFFADVMVRQEFYNINLSNPGILVNNLPVNAQGYSIAASTGYNFDLGNNWFIEPSAGFIYSRTAVTNFTAPGAFPIPPGTGIAGTIQTDDVTSQIGRLSVRGGTTIVTPTVIWQPFASASVFHEFAGDVTSNFVSNNAALVGGIFAGNFQYNQRTTSSRVGTYGQYSLGVAGQLVNTGWLGFVRLDYRNGNNIDGWTGNAGLRYQFTPELLAAAMPTKFKAPPRAVIGATNWNGFYVGGFFGAAAGQTDIGFVTTPTAGNKPRVFGPIGGAQVGYNWHLPNNWVLGVEGDIGAADIRGARTAGNQVFGPGFNSAFWTVQDRTKWQATATGRVGYAWGRTLIYGKGGAAFEDSRVSATCHSQDPGNPCANQAGAVFADNGGFGKGSRTRVGWTVGYGTEFDLGKNWSAKAEYDYLSFGRHTAVASDNTTIMTDKSSISQVKVGVNYRFSGPAALVAKY
jgi:opacity protein-like surface antigen